jgi:hypothetical protein
MLLGAHAIWGQRLGADPSGDDLERRVVTPASRAASSSVRS